ncbi:MAG TPA: uroporphyrinogen-III synthase [Rhodothermales bacterium]|nr:uroporphyrinogen-III synthase [Rhodothermales bacterium]
MLHSSLVCLLREPTSPDPYEQAMEAAGLRSVSVPVLRFACVNQDVLGAALKEPDAFGGLICTSPRSVAALTQVWANDIARQTAWSEKPVFVVGPRTAAAVHDLGLTAVGADSGNAAALAEIICQRTFSLPLLFLSGNRRRDALSDQLTAGGTPFQEICVYETHLRTDLPLDTLPALDWLAFFSPSGVEAVQQCDFDASTIPKAAIGPTTAQAIEAAGWTVDALAQQPAPEALAAAIKHAGLDR